MASASESELDLQTELITACEHGETALAGLCLDRGADVNGTDEQGQAPLFVACQNGHADAARLLLDRGADVECTNYEGNTPLMIACSNGDVTTAQLCIDRGADVERANHSGSTPLHLASHCGSADAARLLLDRGAIVDASPLNDGWAALLSACLAGHVDVVALLIDRGADVNRASHHGRTLQCACEREHVAVAKLILDHGAEVDKVATCGRTPLYIACQHGFSATARLCLVHGANIERQTGGASPYDVARALGHTALAAWLQRIRAAGGWTRYLSEPRYKLVGLQWLAAKGRAGTDGTPLMDFLFPGAPSLAPPQASKQTKKVKLHLPPELLPLVACYYWGGALND